MADTPMVSQPLFRDPGTEDPETASMTGSVFEHYRLADLLRGIQDVYLETRYPFLVAFSGGKDSTAATQLVWQAVAALPKAKRQKPIFVISNDTGVEVPQMADRMARSIRQMQQAAREQDLPITAEILHPPVRFRYMSLLIGKGYSAATAKFRWCTDRIKLWPSQQFTKQLIARYGRVIVVLGLRREESSARKARMAQAGSLGTHYLANESLPRAPIYTPIERWTFEDIWSYVLQVESPWSSESNRDLAALYWQGSGGECPLIVDRPDSASSCGSSRFGCWPCCVVSRNRSLEGQIDSGDDWLEPLLEIRDLLMETTIPENKPKFRDWIAPDGKPRIGARSKVPVPSRYKYEFVQRLLRMVLEAQVKVQAVRPDITLLPEEEIQAIRWLWTETYRKDGATADEAPAIYQAVTGKALPDSEPPSWLRRPAAGTAQLSLW